MNPLNRRALRSLIRKNAPVARTSTRRVFAGLASKTGQLFTKEQLEFERDGNLTNQTILATTACDHGHLLGTNGAEILGTCHFCGAWLCTLQGCGRTCSHGDVVCGNCSSFEDGELVCKDDMAGLRARQHLAWSLPLLVLIILLLVVGPIVGRVIGFLFHVLRTI